MKAAFSPVRRVKSTAHVVAHGQFSGRMRGLTMDDQGACFFVRQPRATSRVCEVCRNTGFRYDVRR